MSKSDPGMDEVITSTKEYALKVMRDSKNANPQEIATIPWLIKTLSEYYKESWFIYNSENSDQVIGILY